jgi:enoyl-CoA hydratase
LNTIQSKAPVAVGKIIETINAADTGNAGFEKEIACFGDCFETEDMKEGAAAFLEKRKANFTGK